MQATELDQEKAGRWGYAAAGFVTLFFGVTTIYLVFNFMAPVFETEYGWSRLEVSYSTSLFWLFDGVSLILLGFLVERFGIRITALFSLLYGIGIMALAILPPSLPTLYLLFSVIGLGAGAASPMVCSIVVTAWFAQRRGLALGVINMGLGAGGATLPYLCSHLIRAYGWQSFPLVLGSLCAVIPCAAYGLVMRMPPGWVGQSARPARPAEDAPDFRLITNRQFWLLCFAVLAASAAILGLFSSALRVLTDRGISQAIAITVLSVFSLASIGTRLVVGALLDLVFAPLISFIVFTFCALGIFLLATSFSAGVLCLGAALVGMGLGAETDIVTYTLSRYIPRHLYGRLFGLMLCIYALGGAFGVFALNWSYNVTGSYDAAIHVIIAMVLASAVCFLCMGPYQFDLAGHEIPRSLRSARLLVRRSV
jgi:MFS family permease